jgi:hypothetical protein
MALRVLSGEPDEGGLCRVCGTPLQAGSLRCAKCSAVHGEGFRCPHCRAVADVEKLPDGRLRCKACGGPRLLLDDGRVALSGAEREPLQLARRAIMKSGLWKALGVGLGVFGALALLVAAGIVALTSPGVILGTLAIAFAALPLLFGFGAYRRGVAAARDREDAWRAAELRVAKDLAQSSEQELTAAALAQTLGMDETRAELLLAELSLDDHVARRVSDTGELVYSARPRVRLTEPATDAELAEALAEVSTPPEEPLTPASARSEKSEP